MSEAQRAVGKLLDDWQATRAAIRAIEEAEHPDLTDHHGRVWQWWKGDLYRHDNTLANTSDQVLDPRIGLPKPGLADDNPNYSGLCSICRREGTQ